MSYREKMVSFNRFGGYHKGFYNDDGDPTNALLNINYTDFFEDPNDEDFPYDSAHTLLRGSCHHFALSLQKRFNYTPYIIEGINRRGFHAFCQVYKGKTWCYIDARGVTTSFDEFMDVAKEFVTDEYVIRKVNLEDIDEWSKDCPYDDEAFKFAEAMIEKFKNYYEI
ncbi:MAG: hypothetical protein J6B86_00635 [Clostridia bacterium]|nr:hypothetical protein [Clostridia bacterium]